MGQAQGKSAVEATAFAEPPRHPTSPASMFGVSMAARSSRGRSGKKRRASPERSLFSAATDRERYSQFVPSVADEDGIELQDRGVDTVRCVRRRNSSPSRPLGRAEDNTLAGPKAVLSPILQSSMEDARHSYKSTLEQLVLDGHQLHLSSAPECKSVPCCVGGTGQSVENPSDSSDNKTSQVDTQPSSKTHRDTEKYPRAGTETTAGTETDTQNEVFLRALILSIQRNPLLDESSKAIQTQALMSSSSSCAMTCHEGRTMDEHPCTEEGREADAADQLDATQQLAIPANITRARSASWPSTVITHVQGKPLSDHWHSEKESVRGCVHYPRNCAIKASCCGEFFPCRICHDEHADHPMNRYETQQIVCLLCGTVQGAGQKCRQPQCGVSFSDYYCDTCKFWDATPNKNIYHCPYCKMCRVGKGLGIDFFHCFKCNACMRIGLKDNHVCVEGALETQCPICLEGSMLHSMSRIVRLRCGHSMHEPCFQQYLATNYTCPICQKSVADMSKRWEQLEAYVAANPMPPEYKDAKADVLCNDCEARSSVEYHFSYMKCPECGSYNTRRI